MSRSLLVALLVAALVAPIAPASAQDSVFEESGTILVGNPASKVVGGATELLAPCDTETDLQGLDGHWIALPEGVGGFPATLASSGIDADVWFYDAACGLMLGDGDTALATDLTADESGAIPAAAAFAVVDLALGALADFTFSIALSDGR